MSSLPDHTIALYFGTFNPVHIGHMIIGQYILEHTDCTELWFVVSPQNPFKQKQSMLSDRMRHQMVELAIKDPYHYKASDIEFGLEKPSYTAHTLAHLKERFPDKNFALIMGSDNLVHFHKWKNYESILNEHHIIVYPRMGKETDRYKDHPHIHHVDAPFIDISSTLIRKGVAEGRDMSYMLPEKVWDFIDGSGLYK